MKKYFFLLMMIFASVFTYAQTSNLIMNDGNSYVGKIDDKAKMSGTIIFNSEKTKNSKDESKIYDLKFSEKGTGKHNGIFSGELSIKKSSDKNQLKFEGTWINYGNTMKFPFYFNNQK